MINLKKIIKLKKNLKLVFNKHVTDVLNHIEKKDSMKIYYQLK